MWQRRAAAVLLVLIPLAAGCGGASASLTPSASVTTAMQGWERWLRVEWTAQARASGQEIDGYVYSQYGSGIFDVQLLAQGLDSGGNVVSQKLASMPGLVPALQRSYFRIGAMPSAASYRVTVWAFDTVQSQGYR